MLLQVIVEFKGRHIRNKLAVNDFDAHFLLLMIEKVWLCCLGIVAC